MSLRYARILAELADMPLAIMETKLRVVMQFLADQSAGVKYSAEEIAARTGADRPTDRQVRGAPGGVAVLSLFGIVAQRMNMMDQVSGPGGTSTEQFAAAFRQAVADPNVKAIVLNIDSPGGSVYGVAELASLIREQVAKGDKPVVAQVNSLAASAAYWIASAAGEIVVTPGGEVGSIGVYTVHEDISAAAEQKGVKVTYISAGDFKVEANPFQPLADEARAAIQKRVDEYYSMFVDAVARGRSAALGRSVSRDEVRQGFGRGRVVGAKEAVKEGMADRVATLDETLRRFGASRGAPAPAQAEDDGMPLLAEEPAAAPIEAVADDAGKVAESPPDAPEPPAGDPPPVAAMRRRLEELELG